MFAGTFDRVMFDKSMESVVRWAATPYGTITVGTAGVILLYLALIAPPRVTLRFLLAGTVVGIAVWIAVNFILATTNPSIFQSSWERVMGEGAFIGHLSQARSLGMKADFSVGTMLVAGVMLSLWVFSGAFNPVYFASEVRNPKRNLLAGSMIALIVAMAILAISTILLQRMVPSEWLSAESYLFHTNGSTVSAMPWLPLYLAVLRPNGTLVQILGLAAVFSYLAMAHTFLYTSSRIMLAWGEDHLIPQYATFVHPELRSPLITVLIVCLLAEGGVMESALNTGINTRINPVFFFVGVELLPVLGITLLPFRKKDWFERASGFLRARIGPLPLISIVGGLGVLYLVAMIAALVIWPGYNPLNIDTLIWFGIMFASGLTWFYGRRFLLRRQSIDIDPMLHNAPDE
jgi:amino acid transporter